MILLRWDCHRPDVCGGYGIELEGGDEAANRYFTALQTAHLALHTLIATRKATTP